MKTLGKIVPSAEQLKLITNPRPAVSLIRGAAGSGKTTTALLMLDQLSSFWIRRKTRDNSISEGVNVLVLTFNKTLSGYIGNLAQCQLTQSTHLHLTVKTFALWAMRITGVHNINDQCTSHLGLLIGNFCFSKNFPVSFINTEVDYILGRFPETALDDYLDCRRVGRGNSPSMIKSTRRELLQDVIYPYIAWKRQHSFLDWNDLPNTLLSRQDCAKYDIIIADEAQDFSANQIRAIMHCASDPSSVIFVLDAAQRIYPRGCTWIETGITISQTFRLAQNYRNTKTICAFAASILDGLEIEDDGTIPNLDCCERIGPKPRVLKGKYKHQIEHCLHYIDKYIDLDIESVAFLKPKGGGWFDELKRSLNIKGLQFVEITRESSWPTGPENIALSTMHSAKGLEFDHVFIIGLNQEVTPHGNDDDDNDRNTLRRLLAMAVTRARNSVIIGCKPKEGSSLISYFAQDTYEEVLL